MQHQLSIIIPVLNEAKTIGDLLDYLLKNSSQKNISEIIIIDGGSNDKTPEIVNLFIFNQAQLKLKNKFSAAFEKKIIFINSAKGRAKQMNTGAKQAKGNIFYFLHADSLPPKNFDDLIISEIQKENLGGCFKMKFNHSHWWLQLASWLTHFKWRACRGGDQSQFIAKHLFEEIGGYNEDFIIYEDNILINELFKRKQFVVIQEWITTSARLYEQKGIWTLQYHFWTIYVKRWFGASADTIFEYYKKHIAA